MNDPQLMAPLAHLKGAKPDAPAWFEAALAQAPERGRIEAEGAGIETLAWGERGKPGLVFLHGGGAHADWWSFIAPFFASDYRVVAPTFSGMGRSDWRPAYAFEQFVREARAAAQACGAYDGGPPLIVGHSFGGREAIGYAHAYGEEIAGAVIVDPPYFAPQNQRPPSPPRPARVRVQPTLETLVARFRLAPAQPVANLFLLDYIARHSARRVVDEQGEPGFALAFDPHFWERFRFVDPVPLMRALRSPLALFRGAKSRLFHRDDAEHFLGVVGPGAPYVEIPEAEHHVMIDQPLAFVTALRGLLTSWPARR